MHQMRNAKPQKHPSVPHKRSSAIAVPSASPVVLDAMDVDSVRTVRMRQTAVPSPLDSVLKGPLGVAVANASRNMSTATQLSHAETEAMSQPIFVALARCQQSSSDS
uniref:Uncharacterized protein n=1 Tax=Phlebotomus papatasi TaxID=29031 RepID=A0A1B0DA51_PHLPP